MPFGPFYKKIKDLKIDATNRLENFHKKDFKFIIFL